MKSTDDPDILAHAKETIASLKDQLIFTEKMALLGSMICGVAHEINNPLNVMMLYSSRLRQLMDNQMNHNSHSSEEEREYTKKIESTSRMILKIATRLQDFSRDGRNDPLFEVSIEDIINNSVELCREFVAIKNVCLTIPPVNPDVRIECRPTQICQVLVNLIKNAVDAVTPLEERWIEIQVQHRDKNALIYVTDSGNGISPENQEKLFQSFFTTKKIGEGTGLGLSISRNIIQNHNGFLYVDTDHPHTRFVIEIPIKTR